MTHVPTGVGGVALAGIVPPDSFTLEAGEAVGSVTASTGGIEGRASIAPVKHVVISGTASYLYIPGDESFIRHSYGELSLGWSDTSGRAFYSFIGGGRKRR